MKQFMKHNEMIEEIPMSYPNGENMRIIMIKT